MYARHFTRSQILLRSVLFPCPLLNSTAPLGLSSGGLWSQEGERDGSLPSMLCSIWAILSGKRRLMDVDGVFWCHQLFLSLMMIDPSVGMNDHLWEIRAPSRTWWKTMFVCLDLPPLLKMKKYKILLCLEKKNEHGNLCNTSVVSSRQQWDYLTKTLFAII